MGIRNGKIDSIMMIEDEDDILLIYKDFLGRKGFRVEVSAPTANEILRDFDAYRPDLVMIDYRLPGSMNGVQAAETILRNYPFARVLIVTAYENVSREIKENEFLSKKNIPVVRKPVQLAHLAKVISTL